LSKEKMKKTPGNKKPLPFEVNRSKDELLNEIAASLTPEERLQKLTRIIHFTKQFSENYYNAFQQRLNEGNYHILK
jgi:hypothetical protein